MKALDQLDIPTSQLISFLSQTLNLGNEQCSLDQPLIFISSTLILCIYSFQRDAKLVGQEELDIREKLSAKVLQAQPKKIGKRKRGNKACEPVDVKEKEEKPKDTDSEDLEEDLQPLGVQRSFSVPIHGDKAQSLKKEAKSPKASQINNFVGGLLSTSKGGSNLDKDG